MKVGELAKQLKLSEFQMMKFLSDFNVRVKNSSSKLDIQTIKLVKELYAENVKEKAAEPLTHRKITADFETIALRDLADCLDVKLSHLMQQVMGKCWLLNLNSLVNWAQASDLAELLNITLERKKQINITKKKAVTGNHPSRPPVITVMGHVDHGKTSLLDKIRKTNVQSTEAGAITQHIGAYQITHNKATFTFLDTPGHAAFTALRSRGAQLTDIVVLVIAADDGVKPQTIEAIDHAKAAGVPIIVAINKIDLPGSDTEKIKQMLTEHELVCEDWGGDVIITPLSAKTGAGIDNLLDMIQLTADILELSAPQTGLAHGVIIEAKLSKQTGPLATVLVQSGCLETGQFFSVGTAYGKVRSLTDHAGKRIKQAGPGMPVEIMGFGSVPLSGTLLQAHKKESDAKKAVSDRPIQSNLTVSGRSDERDGNSLTLIIKGDAEGSVDALKHLISDETRVKVRVVRVGLGDITQDDVNLASISGALIIGFGVKLPGSVKKLAATSDVTVRLYTIIYRAVEDLGAIIQGNRIIDYDYAVIGEAVVRKVYQYSKFGKIAGCYVTSGKLVKSSHVTVHRNKVELDKGRLDSLKRFKEDVTEVTEGFECGVVIKGVAFEEGDIITAYQQVERPVA